MTIYGEFDSQFRKKPAIWRMLLISLSAAVISSLLVSLFTGLAVAAVGRSHNPDTADWILHAPPVPHTGELFAAATETLHRFPVAVGGSALLVGAILIFFWPANPGLATQIFLSVQAMGFLTFGALAPAIAWALPRIPSLREPRQFAIEAGILLVSIVLLVVAERKTVGMLANLVPMESPARRFGLWFARNLVPFGVIAAAGVLGGSLATAIAVGVMLLVTLFENLARRPTPRFQQLRNVEMSEAAAALPLLAALLVAGSLWAFGGIPPLAPRAVVLEKGSTPEFATLEEARKAAWLQEPRSHESVIRMRWSREGIE